LSRLVLDAGAFVAFEKGDVTVRARLAAARRLEVEVTTTAPVVAQVWRDGRRQALLARLLAGTRVDAPDESAARAAGELLAKTKTTDVVDALIALLLRPGDSVLTSDPGDIKVLLDAARLDARVMQV
jgi:predicted nucleic acid-binding protein